MPHSLFRTKSPRQFLGETQPGDGPALRRTFTPFRLIILGVGCIVGAGLFSITGPIAAYNTGPAITFSFILAAIICSLTGLCYAELASRLPVSGSAYAYAYTTIGELPAWLVGWSLVVEYVLGAALVCTSWSQYFVVLLRDAGITLPDLLTSTPAEGGIIDLPAMFIAGVMAVFVVRGAQTSAMANNILVALKLGIIFLFVVLGWRYVKSENLTPYLPANTGEFGSFGISGVLRGASVAFVAFLGFDSVSAMAQETKNPARSMPIGILGSLVVVAVVYVLFGYVLTGVANYHEFQGADSIAPVSVAIAHLPWPWLNRLIVLAILMGYSSVVLVLMMAQSRIFMSMSRDGVLPKVFGRIHPAWRTPWLGSIILALVIALFSGLMPGEAAGELCSIGTLFAFTIVCYIVIVLHRRDRKAAALKAQAGAALPAAAPSPIEEGKLPYTAEKTVGGLGETVGGQGESAQPEATFRTPWVPFIPLLSIAISLVFMFAMPLSAWISLGLWLLAGAAIYFGYGYRHSTLNSKAPSQDEK